MTVNEMIPAFEAILFASGEPVETERFCEQFEIDMETAENVMDMLADRLDKSGSAVKVLRLGACYQLATRKEFGDTIRTALDLRRKTPLSQAALEVLAVIAYNQPVTRAYIDTVRGVDSSYSVSNLLERGLIEAKGRLDAPGRPMLYGTSTNFLRCFGLTSLGDLPGVNSEEAAEMLKRMEEQLSSQMPDKNQLTLDESIELALIKSDSEATDEATE